MEPTGTILQPLDHLSALKINDWRLAIRIPLLVFLHFCLCIHTDVRSLYEQYCLGACVGDVLVKKTIHPSTEMTNEERRVEILKYFKELKLWSNIHRCSNVPNLNSQFQHKMVFPHKKKPHWVQSFQSEWLWLWFIHDNHCGNQAHVSFPSPHYPQIDIEMPFNIHLHVNTCGACSTTRQACRWKKEGKKAVWLCFISEGLRAVTKPDRDTCCRLFIAPLTVNSSRVCKPST